MEILVKEPYGPHDLYLRIYWDKSLAQIKNAKEDLEGTTKSVFLSRLFDKKFFQEHNALTAIIETYPLRGGQYALDQITNPTS